MKSTKLIAILVAIALFITLFVSCATDTKTSSNDIDGDGVPFNSIEDAVGKTIVTVNAPGVAESIEANGKVIFDLPAEGTEYAQPIFVDTMSDVISTLKSGRGDYSMVFTPTAKYYAAIDDTIGYTEIPADPNSPEGFVGSYSVSMTTRADDTELLEMLNNAISELKANGTLDKQLNDYVEKLSVAATDAIPVTDGAKTINVGISGDAPPFDYVDPAGKPAGFNVELMKAIAAKAGFNVNFVTINTSAKFAALESDRIDIYFYNTNMPNEVKEGYTQTEAYAAEVTMSNLYVK